MARTAAAMGKYAAATAAYLRNLENTGASPVTVRNYASRLENFRQHWQERTTATHAAVQDPSYVDVQYWRDCLADLGRKPSTIKQYLKELSIFFSWASDETLGDQRYYKENPVSRRLVPDTRKLDKRPYDSLLTDEQVMLLWRNNPPADGRTCHYWARNYAIVVLALSTELRNAEILSLRLSDLDFDEEEITVESGKGGKFRVVDFPFIAQTAVRLYLVSGLRPSWCTEDDLLFGTRGDPRDKADPAQTWCRGTPQWLSGVVERHVRLITGVRDIRTHDLRHVGARLDLNNGMTFAELQAKLGHESVSTTQIYSGKLMSRRRHRRQAAQVYAERTRQAYRNAELLAPVQQEVVDISSNIW